VLFSYNNLKSGLSFLYVPVVRSFGRPERPPSIVRRESKGSLRMTSPFYDAWDSGRYQKAAVILSEAKDLNHPRQHSFANS